MPGRIGRVHVGGGKKVVGAVAVRPIVGPWGQIDVVVEKHSDGRWYAVLRQPPEALRGVVGTSAPDEEEAVALLRLECLRAYGGP